MLPQGRSATRQIFIEEAPEHILEFFVRRAVDGTPGELEIINYAINGRQFGFSVSTLRGSDYWREQDAHFFSVFQYCLDLAAITAPTYPLGTEGVTSLLSSIASFVGRGSISPTREAIRSRFLVNVITRKLSRRVKILDSYRDFISANREPIERNLGLILSRNLITAKDIRTVINVHPAITEGTL